MQEIKENEQRKGILASTNGENNIFLDTVKKKNWKWFKVIKVISGGRKAKLQDLEN